MNEETLVNRLFDGCVDVLNVGAGFFGISYEAINVIVFCIIWPLFTLALLVTVVVQRKKLKALK